MSAAALDETKSQRMDELLVHWKQATDAPFAHRARAGGHRQALVSGHRLT